jgi:UDP-GlcNAc:undecaprenyl-phosphate/decaprenyl-phosphate GlcNAc-1-phosphate transferase
VELFLAFIVALSITAALIPFLALWAPGVGLTDRPGPRKVHEAPVPRVGGIAMAAGILGPVLVTIPLSPSLVALLVGMLVLLAFGIWDDRAGLGYKPKLIGQILAVALCMYLGDVRVETVTIGTRTPLPELLSVPLTFVFLVGVTNAVNLADGLDGLAGGMALLCLCAIALLAAASGNSTITTVALIEAGAILGFLRFNTHPARVFMGDGGSQVLGFSIGVLAILATQAETSAVSAAIPLLLIGVPILDTLAVMMRRLRERRSPFAGDRSHLHHRLLELQFTHAEAVMLIYLLQAAFFLAAYFLRFESDVLIAIVFTVLGVGVIIVLRQAARGSWRAHPHGSARWLERVRNALPAYHLPRLTLAVMGFGLVTYSATVIAASRRVGSDVGVLCLTLLVMLLAIGAFRSERSLQWIDRVAAYVGVVLLVYLDQTTGTKSSLLIGASWTLLGITAVAAVVRFLLSSPRRFEISTLDLLVVFIAMVIPNLPGSVQMPEELAAGIAKAVMLLYVVEVLLSAELRRLVPRALLALIFAAIVLRSLLAPLA